MSQELRKKVYHFVRGRIRLYSSLAGIKDKEQSGQPGHSERSAINISF